MKSRFGKNLHFGEIEGISENYVLPIDHLKYSAEIKHIKRIVINNKPFSEPLNKGTKSL